MSNDIEMHDFNDEDVHAQIEGDEVWIVATAYSALQKRDVIALAKHFKLTAYDIDCSEFKALQIDANQADEDHFDECVKIQADKIKINKRLS